MTKELVSTTGYACNRSDVSQLRVSLCSRHMCLLTKHILISIATLMHSKGNDTLQVTSYCRFREGRSPTVCYLSALLLIIHRTLVSRLDVPFATPEVNPTSSGWYQASTSQFPRLLQNQRHTHIVMIGFSKPCVELRNCSLRSLTAISSLFLRNLALLSHLQLPNHVDIVLCKQMRGTGLRIMVADQFHGYCAFKCAFSAVQVSTVEVTRICTPLPQVDIPLQKWEFLTAQVGVKQCCSIIAFVSLCWVGYMYSARVCLGNTIRHLHPNESLCLGPKGDHAPHKLLLHYDKCDERGLSVVPAIVAIINDECKISAECSSLCIILLGTLAQSSPLSLVPEFPSHQNSSQTSIPFSDIGRAIQGEHLASSEQWQRP
mmetsp:Transcript_10169/g.30793  ORF Transcript_10169/g.30793 Transcript_10169/m.30793 type:complete len:374 (+) Transcript_10169:115-1236(+)